jgi:hypothetical protein
MTHRRRNWLFVGVFWILFAGSMGLDTRYPLLKTAWVIALLIYFAIGSTYALAEIFRNRDGKGDTTYPRAVYRWWMSFALDEDDPKTSKGER